MVFKANSFPYSYRHNINDGSYQTERSRKSVCKRVKACIAESGELISAVVDEENAEEGGEDTKEDDDEE